MSGQGDHFAIVVGGFYEQLAQRLIAGASAAYEQEDATFEIFELPGAFELPLAASYAAASGRFDGVACLGAVIRGETDHYDYVCAEAARGIQDVSLRTHVPCAFGVLTCENMDQALARTGGGKRDQGAHAAQATLRMAALRRSFKKIGTPGCAPGHGAGSPRDGLHVLPARAAPTRDDQLGPGTPRPHRLS